MSTHTKEPWTLHLARVGAGAPVFGFTVEAEGKVPPIAGAGVAPSDHALIVAEEFRATVTTGFTEAEVEANGRRIVAAVNAVAGLTTEQLERIAAQETDRERMGCLSGQAMKLLVELARTPSK